MQDVQVNNDKVLHSLPLTSICLMFVPNDTQTLRQKINDGLSTRKHVLPIFYLVVSFPGSLKAPLKAPVQNNTFFCQSNPMKKYIIRMYLTEDGQLTKCPLLHQ